VISFTLRPLYPWGNIHRYQMYRRLGGPQSRSRCGVEKEKSLYLPGIEPRSSNPYLRENLKS
jgi:hypothetical protein